ncbi:Hypothetical predicted protein [Pelobates cultripes]|uniref:Uncharacterized protein n=1 Tax=Pelobates cultripes TaxID=61616 RepID=A0AAD1SBJ8_PELCU|nr:Hypothetical predicted protein [Pelobates cultripes]
MGTCEERLNDTMTKLDEILAGFWARILERVLNAATASRTTPALTPPALPGPRGGRRIIAARGSPKEQHKQKRRACHMTSTRPPIKPQQPHNKPEAPCPPGQLRSADKAQPHHHNSETWHLATYMPLMSQETGAPGAAFGDRRGSGEHRLEIGVYQADPAIAGLAHHA